MKWHDVASSEKYLNADADTQTQIQEKFYSQYVEPEAVKRGLDSASVRNGFFAKVSGIPQINSASDVEGGESILKSKDDFLASVSSPDQLLEWRSKGKIGVVEAYQKMNKWEMLPYLNAKATWDSVSVLRDINRHQNGEQLTEEEKTRVSDFVSDMLEIEARGYSVPGGIAQGVLQLPAFAVEFATSGGLTKGVKFGLGKAAKQGIKGAISKAVNVSAKLATTGAARTALMPHRVAKTYADNMISDSISLTDKGEAVFKNADTKPATAAMKAFGDVWVEMVSEETGGVLLNPLFGKVRRGLGKAVPEKLKTEFAKLVKETTDLPIAQAVKKGGFDGVLEEIGEERIGDLLRTTLDLDQQEGYSTDQFIEAIAPDADQFLIEAGIIGMWGGASKATQIVKNRLLSQGKSKEEVEGIISGLTEVEREGLAFGARDIETAETEAAYTEERARIVQSMVDANIEDAESIASLIDARVIAIADAEGLPKYEVAKKWGLQFQRKTFDEFMGITEQEAERLAMQQADMDLPTQEREPMDDMPFQDALYQTSQEGSDIISRYLDVKESIRDNKLSFNELLAKTKEGRLLREQIAKELGSLDKPVRLTSGENFAFVSQETYDEGLHRVTYFDNNKQPTGHTTFKTKQEAIAKALDDGYLPVANQTLFQSSTPDTIDIDGTQKPTTNSLGNPIANTEQGIRNFYKWFGDSKVVDEQGRPLVVYHGTASDFSEFSLLKAKDKEGRERGLGWGKDKFYFADNPYGASSAASGAEYFGRGKSQNVMPVYLRIESLIESSEYLAKVESFIAKGKSRDAAISSVDKQLKKDGIDGIIDRNTGGIAVFSPIQIKSAIGNRGTFATNDPNILYQGKRGATQFGKDKTDVSSFREEIAQSTLPETIDIDGVERPTVNSLGNPIANTEQGIRNFYKWFGDSKVVDEQGRPLVIYHGTQQEFTEFKNLSRNGLIYFTKNKQFAERYSKIFKGNPELPTLIDIFIESNPDVIGEYDILDANKLWEKRDLLEDYDIYEKFSDKEDMQMFFEKVMLSSGSRIINGYLSANKAYPETMAWYKAEALGAKFFKEQGYDYVNIIDDGGEITLAVFNPTQIKSVDNVGTFNPQDANILRQEKRGSIQFGKNKTIITLFEDADKSTVLHELGHLFLRDLNSYAQDTKSAVTQEQMQTVRQWLGNDGGAFTVEQEEQFARGFEAYLLTGKAPTTKLEAIFNKFKEWLRSVYGSMKALKVEMSPEIMRAFDSMLMTEAEKQATGFYDAAESGVFERLFQGAREFFAEDTEIQESVDNIEELLSGRATEVEGQALSEINALLKIIKQRVPRAPESLYTYMHKNKLYVKESSARAMGVYDALKEMNLIRVNSGITREDSLIEALRDFTNVYGKAESYEETSDQWSKTISAIEDARNVIRPSDADKAAYIEGLEQDIAEAEERLNMTQTKADTLSLIKDLKKMGFVAVPKDAAKNVQKQIKAMNKRASELTKRGIKLTQQNVSDYIKSLPISMAGRSKLMTDLKNAGVQTSLMKSLENIRKKAATIYKEEQKRLLRSRIKRELKRTKPSRVSGKKVGKFDYETNLIFDELREIHGLSKEAAQERLVMVDENPADEIELIKRRALSFVATGSKTSLPLTSAVFNDIISLKQMGRNAKDLEELTAKINKAQDIDEIVKAVKDTSGNKDTFATKVGNLYRRGFANLYSLLNSVSNKAIADKYDFERKQAQVQTAIYFKMIEIKKETSAILNLKPGLDKHDISVEFNKFVENMAKEDYQITDKKGRRYKLSKLEILDVYNAVKNEDVREDFFATYGEEQVNELVSNLTEQEAKFGDLLQEKLEEYYERINPIYVELYGLDMPEVKKYWPSTNEHSSDIDIFQEFKASAQTPGFMKERLKGVKRPIIKNAWRKFANHIAQAEHLIEMGLDYRRVALAFKDGNVKYEISEKFGDDVYRDLMQHIDGLSLSKQTQILSAVDKGLGEILNNWVVAKIALNPMIFVKQLGSITNYAEQMPVADWTKYLFEGLANPKETKDYMFKVSPYLEARYAQGYNESIERAIQSAGSLSKFKGDMTQTLTALVRMGDIGAVIYGGYPLVKYQMAQGKSEADAVAEFERQTLKSQQAGVSSSLSLFQQNRAFANRFFLAFKNTPAQYLRKISDAIIMYQNGDISREQMNKTLISYLVVQPAIYAAIGEAMGKVLYDRDMEIFDEIMMQLFMNPLSAVPLLGDIINAVVRKMAGEPNYRVFSIPMLDDISNMFAKMSKKNLDIFDAISIIGTPIEVTTGIPVQTFNRMIKERFK